MTTERIEPTVHEIRRVALEMFATRGYDATSVRDIADAVGVRGATLYHHFASKEEILWDLTQSALDALAASWRRAREQVDGTSPLDLFGAFVRAHVRFHIDRRTDAALVNAQLSRLSPDHFNRAAEQRHTYEQELTSIVRSCLADGFHDVPDLRVTVFAILQMAIAIPTWYQPNGPLTDDEIVSAYENLAVKMIALPKS